MKTDWIVALLVTANLFAWVVVLAAYSRPQLVGPEPTCVAIPLERQHSNALIVSGRALRVCAPALDDAN